MLRGRNITLGIMILLFILVSCAGKTTYRFNNVTYESPESLVVAQKTYCDQILSKITPTENPVGGVAVFISPSIKYIKENLITYKGSAISDEKKEEMSAFLAKRELDVYRCDYEVIEKRRIFDKVIYTSNDNPESAAFSEDIAILRFKKDTKVQYFIKRKNNPAEITPIEPISTAMPPVLRLNIWLDNIEKVARGK
jgi:hypothetical protein